MSVRCGAYMSVVELSVDCGAYVELVSVVEHMCLLDGAYVSVVERMCLLWSIHVCLFSVLR